MGPTVDTAAVSPSASQTAGVTANVELDGANAYDDDASCRTFYAVRRCVALKGPALFFDGSDCSFYLDGATEEDEVEFREFSALADAVQYLATRTTAHANNIPPFETIRNNEKKEQFILGRRHATANHPKAITRKTGHAALMSFSTTPLATTATRKRGRPKKRTLGNGYVVVNGSGEQEQQQQQQQHQSPPPKRKRGHGTEEEEPRRQQEESPPPPSKREFASRHGKPLVDWDTMFARLKAYKDEHGHLNVPVKEDRYLHNWIYSHRRQYALFTSTSKDDDDDDDSDGSSTGAAASSSSKVKSFTAEQFGKLIRLGVRLESRNAREGRVTWEERAREWLAYKRQRGRDPPHRGGYDGLGVWVVRQRCSYARFMEGKKTSLTQSQIDTLTAWGFTWEQRTKKTFDERFRELLKYKREHGTTAVPHLYPGLGCWVHSQRNYYGLWLRGKKSSMTQEKIDRLNAVGFIWRQNATASSGRRRRRAAMVNKDASEKELADF